MTASYTIHKLGKFWKRSTLSKRKKILMYEAIVTSKLMYVLDATPLTTGDYNSLNACFFKGLRQILGLKTTYGQMFSEEERSNTNKKLMEEVNKELGNKGPKKTEEPRKP